MVSVRFGAAIIVAWLGRFKAEVAELKVAKVESTAFVMVELQRSAISGFEFTEFAIAAEEMTSASWLSKLLS
ncbi:hypothetical protein EV361DRAFT_884783 [Lentinula raphanica]|nr:hypothetical protein EV361DRAFT_884783 [Lentinula raphanica]